MALSVKERLAAKAARRSTLDIATDDPSDAYAAYQRAEVALGTAGVNPQTGETREVSDEDLKRLVELRDAAKADYDAMFIAVSVKALPADEWEALLDAHQLDGDRDPEVEDVVDWAELLPLLLAASCEDEDLQDPDWWAETLSGPGWSKGQKLELQTRLTRLNVETEQRAGKG